jgi:secreted PhoX family phosphatase
MPTLGENAGKAYPFAIAPMDTEICGLRFSNDNESLFLAIQHPGEGEGMRQNLQSEVREFAMRTTTGQVFMQKRTVPIGSNWPAKAANEPPRPAVVAVRRIERGAIAPKV